MAAGLLIAVAAAAAYHGSFSGPFVFDDIDAVIRNPTIRHLWPPGPVLSPPADSTVGGRPLLNLSLAVNYALGGLGVGGYHAVNLAIHILAGLTLFGIARRALARVAPALVIALLWTLHPLQTESVTYVSQRAELLAGLLCLTTLYCLVRATAPPRSGTAPPAAARWLVLGVAACLLGMAAKETMATAPLAVLLYDRAFVAGSFAEAWRRRRWFYAGLAATWLPLAALVATAGWSRGGSAGFGVGVTSGTYALTQLKAVVLYLRLALWPDALSFDYGMGLVTGVRSVALQGAVIAVLIAAAAAALVRRPALGFPAVWFFLTLAPSSSIIPVATQTMAEHRMYLPLAGVAALAAFALFRFAGRAALPAGLALACALGLLTERRNAVYRTAESLWADTVAACPGNPRAHNNLGFLLLHEGRTAEAAEHFGTALRLYPDYADAHFNLGNAFLQTGRNAEAAGQFEETLRLHPDYADACVGLDVALTGLGRPAEAMAWLERAARLAPDRPDIRFNLGRALMAEGRNTEAAAQFEEALRLFPDDAETRNNLGILLAESSRLDEARKQFAEAVRLKPDYARAHGNLGGVLAAEGELPAAVAEYGEALRLDPGLVEARANLGLALMRQGRPAEARMQLEKVLQSDPDYAPAREALRRLQAGPP